MKLLGVHARLLRVSSLRADPRTTTNCREKQANEYSVRCININIVDESTKGHGDFDAEKENVFENNNNNLFDNNEDANCTDYWQDIIVYRRTNDSRRMLKNKTWHVSRFMFHTKLNVGNYKVVICNKLINIYR